jgi:hypothetical protein
MLIPPALQQRYRYLFGFYDRNGDALLTLADDHGPAAEVVADRWQGRQVPLQDLLAQL